MFSKFFIDRPIFATVLSLFLVLAGLAAMRILPIAVYPDISPPVVNVRAICGASAVLRQLSPRPSAVHQRCRKDAVHEQHVFW